MLVQIRRSALLCFAVLVFMAGASCGDTFRIDLPELENLSIQYDTITAGFNLGRGLSRVDAVRIRFEGTFYPGLGYCFNDPPHDLGDSIQSRMQAGGGTYWEATSSYMESFGAFAVETLFSRGSFQVPTWDFLLDGQAAVETRLEGVFPLCMIISSMPKAYITTAELIIEGEIEERIYHVDGVDGNDSNDGLSRETAFLTIQKGVDTAMDGDEVLVWPAVYSESVQILDKAMTVRSAADAAVLEASGATAVSIDITGGQGSVLKNFVIRDSDRGIYVLGGSPNISCVSLVGNGTGIEADGDSDPCVSNCILWDNGTDLLNCEVSYSCVEAGAVGPGNISTPPIFADANGGDYHLKSERGRYRASTDEWILDDLTSPAVDGGEPYINPANERMPNGGRINMGAYGNTAYASMSEWEIAGDENRDGIFNFVDFAILLQDWLESELWY